MDNSKLWMKSSLQTKRDALDFLEEIFPDTDWEDDEVILDAGSGAGDLTEFILHPYSPPTTTIVGCDISDEMVEYATERFGRDNLSFKHMDISSPDIWSDWEKESFNKIFSFYTLHWISDKRQAVKNFYSLLKPGGEMFLQFPAKYHLMEALKIIFNKCNWSPELKKLLVLSEHYPMQSPEEFSEVLKEIGFKDVDVKIKHATFKYQDLKLFMSTAAYLIPSNVQKDERDLFLDCLEKTYLEENLIYLNPTNGKVRTEYDLLHVRAKK